MKVYYWDWFQCFSCHTWYIPHFRFSSLCHFCHIPQAPSLSAQVMYGILKFPFIYNALILVLIHYATWQEWPFYYSGIWVKKNTTECENVAWRNENNPEISVHLCDWGKIMCLGCISFFLSLNRLLVGTLCYVIQFHCKSAVTLCYNSV